MPNPWKCRIIGAFFLMAFPSFGAPETATNAPAGEERFFLKLTDGSTLLCKPLIEKLPVKTAYADMEIPLARIQAVQMDRESKKAGLSLKNGDKLQGDLNLKAIEIDTLLGKLTVPLDHISALTTSLEEPVVIKDSPARRNACINNLRMMDAAKEQTALANRLTEGTAVTGEEIGDYIKGGWDAMKCPAGGKYTLEVIGKNPKCSAPGHKLPVGD